MRSRRTPNLIVGYGVMALLVGACGLQSEPQEAASSGSEAAPSASPSNPEATTSQSPCSRPAVRAASPSTPGQRRTVGYEVRGLGLPDGSTVSGYSTLAINDAGQVVGTARIGGASGLDRAYRWNPGGRIDYIEGAEGEETMAHDVNSSGQVAGDLLASEESQAFVWDEGTGLRALGMKVGTGVDYVYDVRLNDRGQASGTLEMETTGWRSSYVAFRMEPDGTVSEAPVEQAEVSDMNASGEVVLTVEDEATFERELYVWQAGGTLLDGGPIRQVSYPKINDAGLVVGEVAAGAAGEDEGCGFAWETRTGSRTALGLGVTPGAVNGGGQVTGGWGDGDVWRAFLWDSAAGLVDLGTLPGYDSSYGVAINDHGQVIGRASNCCSGDDRGTSFLWDPGAGMIELLPLHANDSTFAAAINNSGVVVGVSGLVDPDLDGELVGEPVIWSPTR